VKAAPGLSLAAGIFPSLKGRWECGEGSLLSAWPVGREGFRLRLEEVWEDLKIVSEQCTESTWMRDQLLRIIGWYGHGTSEVEGVAPVGTYTLGVRLMEREEVRCPAKGAENDTVS
jgi:hypothetical protein